MTPWVLVLPTLFTLAVVWFILRTKKAGPRELPAEALERASTIVRLTADAPGPGWVEPGRATRVEGLAVRFDHDDDPAARATLRVPGWETAAGGTLANFKTIRLGSEFETHHVHTAGYVFRLRLRGTGAAVGRETRIQMIVDNDGRPCGGRIENDDDTDAAVAAWIEVEWAEVLEVGTIR